MSSEIILFEKNEQNEFKTHFSPIFLILIFFPENVGRTNTEINRKPSVKIGNLIYSFSA